MVCTARCSWLRRLIFGVAAHFMALMPHRIKMAQTEPLHVIEKQNWKHKARMEALRNIEPPPRLTQHSLVEASFPITNRSLFGVGEGNKDVTELPECLQNQPLPPGYQQGNPSEIYSTEEDLVFVRLSSMLADSMRVRPEKTSLELLPLVLWLENIVPKMDEDIAIVKKGVDVCVPSHNALHDFYSDGYRRAYHDRSKDYRSVVQLVLLRRGSRVDIDGEEYRVVDGRIVQCSCDMFMTHNVTEDGYRIVPLHCGGNMRPQADQLKSRYEPPNVFLRPSSRRRHRNEKEQKRKDKRKRKSRRFESSAVSRRLSTPQEGSENAPRNAEIVIEKDATTASPEDSSTPKNISLPNHVKEPELVPQAHPRRLVERRPYVVGTRNGRVSFLSSKDELDDTFRQELRKQLQVQLRRDATLKPVRPHRRQGTSARRRRKQRADRPLKGARRQHRSSTSNDLRKSAQGARPRKSVQSNLEKPKLVQSNLEKPAEEAEDKRSRQRAANDLGNQEAAAVKAPLATSKDDAPAAVVPRTASHVHMPHAPQIPEAQQLAALQQYRAFSRELPSKKSGAIHLRDALKERDMEDLVFVEDVFARRMRNAVPMDIHGVEKMGHVSHSYALLNKIHTMGKQLQEHCTPQDSTYVREILDEALFRTIRTLTPDPAGMEPAFQNDPFFNDFALSDNYSM